MKAMSVDQRNAEIAEYLRITAELIPNGLNAWILQNGRAFTPAKRPRGVRKLRNGLCYKHAAHLAIRNPDRYTYVEGYGLSVIPVQHAWCVDADGNVVDPTWKNPEDRGYFGVKFKVETLERYLVQQGVYGLLCTPSTAGEIILGGMKVDERGML